MVFVEKRTQNAGKGYDASERLFTSDQSGKTGNEERKATKTYTGKTKDNPENMTRDAE